MFDPITSVSNCVSDRLVPIGITLNGDLAFGEIDDGSLHRRQGLDRLRHGLGAMPTRHLYFSILDLLALYNA